MELRGIPSVTIASAVFRPLAESEAAAFQLPGIPVLDVPHPVATHSDEELKAIGAGLIDAILEALTDSSRQ